MSKKVSDLTVDEFTDLIIEVIDRRLTKFIDEDGELREDFVEELLKRKATPDLVDFEEAFIV